ncbi:sugar O-acetyltransferase [Gordonia crocea]|uniref:Acetyltransferase n=1 Tax=Gordonia crocea TaxID=589162 RepID=A0A7I9V110_9ACTN|nr:sugar O-acetyltransferase [Gordonia crocea]GED99085.1 maltose O-acetyltransferase [Gordonia crocea]
MGEQRERMLTGQLYRDSDPELVADRIRAQRLCDEFNRTGPDETARRTALLGDLLGRIGEGSWIMPRVQLLTAQHPIEDHEARRQRWESAAPIRIGDNAWFGGGVIVCPGVTIGSNTVVGAGSVVTRDLPDRVLAAGNPARVIRTL